MTAIGPRAYAAAPNPQHDRHTMVDGDSRIRPDARGDGSDLIRIAVLGAGLIGRRHAGLIAEHPHTALAAIADPDPGSAAVADEFAVPWHADLDGLLASPPAPDAVIVATPNALHREHALRFIDAGIPVLMEKPIATSTDDGTLMAEASERRGVPLLVGHHRRHSPIVQSARAVVASGALGDVVAVNVTTLFAKPRAYFEGAEWRRRAGGGPILINLIHDIDALRTIVGDVVAVQAAGANQVRGFPVEETVAVALRFANGALGTMVLSDAAASPLSWELTSGEDDAYPQQPDRDCYHIAGTLGSLGVPTMRMTTYEGPPSWRSPIRTSVVDVAPEDPLRRQLGHFCAVVRGRERPLVTARDAVESLRVTLAVAEAVETGQAVSCGPATQA